MAPASARAEFAALVSPPRFELKARPGERLRQVFDIEHAGAKTGRYRIYTNDWQLDASGGPVFQDALAPDSCRPWVVLERRELALGPGAKHRFRFEIEPPAETPARECRFAIMIEGLEAAQTGGALNVSVAGRIAVIVYVAVGAAAPRLELVSSGVSDYGGALLPMLEIANRGNAHGRLGGYVELRAADGSRIEASLQDVPILPGTTRRVLLVPTAPQERWTTLLRYPLRLSGAVEASAGKLALEVEFRP
ncbi:MAG: hypothetical protein N3F11_11395 [Casimicrobiaceae bacterium]|nr:hypothetical protein [Casimicrobiaceae bacterium]